MGLAQWPYHRFGSPALLTRSVASTSNQAREPSRALTDASGSASPPLKQSKKQQHFSFNLLSVSSSLDYPGIPSPLPSDSMLDPCPDQCLNAGSAAAMTSSQPLAPTSDLAISAVSFLNERFHSREDLSQAASLVSELEVQCVDLDRQLIELNSRLGASLVAYSSFSDGLHSRFGAITVKLKELASLTDVSDPTSGSTSSKLAFSILERAFHNCLENLFVHYVLMFECDHAGRVY